MPELKRLKSSYVVKRDGREEVVHFDKIVSRIEKLSDGLDRDYVDPIDVAQVTIGNLFPGITTTQVDDIAAETAADMIGRHPDYAILASRIAVSNLHKITTKDFSEVVRKLYTAKNPLTGEGAPLVSEGLHEIVMANAERLNSTIVHERDYLFNFFGIRKLQKSYLLKIAGVTVERPQHMFLRVSLGIHKKNIDAAIETYNLMSEHWFSFGTPTLFNSGTRYPQTASSFTVMMKEDSIDGIFETLKKCAIISKYAGGIGLGVHNIRATGSPIAGTCGISNGLVPMLRVFNNSVRYVDQGGDKRIGALAVYLEPWHADIMQTLELKKKVGDELVRCRDLNFALWVPDLFMKRVKENGKWSLMCPAECPGLYETWGEEFEKLYTKYETDGLFKKQIDARRVWEAIMSAQIETGMPYIVYKDTCNRKSNQKHLGTIKCSSFGAENVQFSSPEEIAVCGMASMAVNKFVTEDRKLDYKQLHEAVKNVTVSLNKMIDSNHYALPEAERSSKRHRAIGIGVQGLADAFLLMRLPFTSPTARDANKRIFETIYHAALESSCELAAKNGPYETFKGSPASKGILQYDMWNVTPTDQWNWDTLKKNIRTFGLRNSLVTCQMPTSFTAQILGNSESIQPYITNVYTRVLSSDFQVFNPHLLRDLVRLGLWDEEMKVDIVVSKGSLKDINRIPVEIKELYRTIWEIPQKDLINMALDRAPFIDQSQTLDIFIADLSFGSCTSMHFYGWEKGLKTGLHLLKTRPAVELETHFTTGKARAWEKAVKEKANRLVDDAIAAAESTTLCTSNA